jgi:hypothetical protein
MQISIMKGTPKIQSSAEDLCNDMACVEINAAMNMHAAKEIITKEAIASPRIARR